MVSYRVTKYYYRRILLEKGTEEGESPVFEIVIPLTPKSTAGHVEPCRKTRGPSRKAKYSLVTDSEPVP